MPRTKAIASGTESSEELVTSKYARLTETEMALILRLKAADYQQQEIAKIIGCSNSTITDFLQRVGDPESVIQKVLIAKELKAAAAWDKAMDVAAKRGDHRPARELIEAARPGLRPQQGNSAGGVGVQVIIGMPGSPVQLPTIEVSPIRPQLESETGSKD